MRTADEIRQAAEPFPDGLIEQVTSGDGGKADYVAWYHYAQRLLKQVGGYSWTVANIIRDGDDWVCHGRLELSRDEWYDGIGSDEHYIAHKGKPNERLVSGTAKNAESDAFKRACSKAGFGLHLWAGKDYWLAKSLEREEGAE